MSKKMIKNLGVGALAVLAAGGAMAQSAPTGIAAIFAAVDLSTVVAFVVATGVLVIGICLSFKGIDLGKRGVKKA